MKESEDVPGNKAGSFGLGWVGSAKDLTLQLTEARRHSWSPESLPSSQGQDPYSL